MTARPDIINRLGKDVIRQALSAETAEKRANAVQRIGRDIRGVELSEADRLFATKLMSRICEDVSALVRRALSVTLRNSPNLPIEIARKLIADVDSIAVPILSSSPVLTDADLVQVLNSKAAEKIRAVAQRQTLSLHISHAIVSFGDSAATAKLAANDGALVSPDTAKLIAELHADDDLIRDAALSRHDFPPDIIAKLIDHSAQKIDANLKSYPGLSDGRAAAISKATAERTHSYVIGEGWPESRLRDYAKSLDKSGKLTPRLILRAAGRGDIRFVTAALSVLGGQSLEKTRLMLLAGGSLGVKAAALRARFRGSDVTILKTAIAIYKDVERQGTDQTAQQFQRRIMQRLLTSDIDIPPTLADELLDVLDGHGAIREVA